MFWEGFMYVIVMSDESYYVVLEDDCVMEFDLVLYLGCLGCRYVVL